MADFPAAATAAARHGATTQAAAVMRMELTSRARRSAERRGREGQRAGEREGRGMEGATGAAELERERV